MRSFVEQLLHYYERDHVGPLEAPIDCPAAWDRASVGNSWRVPLDPVVAAELAARVIDVERSGRPTHELHRDDVYSDAVSEHAARWRAELVDGRGFLVVSGFPTEQWTMAQTEIACWIIGLHLGEPGAQNLEGDLVGHVTDFGTQLAHADERLYRTNRNIRFHCDAADVVGLLCRTSAPTGGLSRLVSSITVFNQLLATEPELARHLFTPFRLDARLPEGAPQPWIDVQPATWDGARLRTFMHLDYYTSVARHPGVDLDDLSVRALGAWERIAERSDVHLNMALAPGDLQLVNNHSVVHARTAYVDDPDHRRDLVRLWLSLVEGPARLA